MAAALDPAVLEPQAPAVADLPHTAAYADERARALQAQDQPVSSAAPKNLYDTILDEQDQGRETRLRGAIIQADQTTPDRAAASLKLAQQTGLPVDVVQRNFDAIQKRTTVADTPYPQILRDTPHLATWVAEHPAHAAVAQADTSPGGQAMDHLGALEWLVQFPQRAIAQAISEERAGSLRGASLLRELTQAEQDQLTSYKYQATVDGKLGAGDSWFKGALTKGMKLLTSLTVPEALPTMVSAAGGAVLGGIAGSIVPGPGTIAGAVGGATLGAEAGYTYGLGKSAFLTAAGSSYDEYLTLTDATGATLDPQVAKAAALANGAFNAGLMLVGGKAIGSTIAAGSEKLTGVFAKSAIQQALQQPTVVAALGTMMKTYGTTLTEGTALMVAMKAGDILARELAKTTQAQPVHATPGAVAGELGSAAAEAVQSFALVALAGPAIGLTHDAARASRAQVAPAFFQALGEGVSQSKTAQRLPQAAQDFLTRATKDGPVETVYAPVDTWAAYWTRQGVDAAQMAEAVTGHPDAYAQAVQTGADLAIPTARYATTLAPTDHNAFFAQELKLGPDEMNGRESAAWLADQQAHAAEPPAEPAPLTAVERVHQDLLAQQTQAGTPADVAEQHAALVGAGFGSLAERAGLDPAEVYRGYGLTVARPDATAADAAALGTTDAPSVEGSPAAAVDPAAAIARLTDTSPTPERRQTAGAAPDGVERRAASDEPINAMADIPAAAARMRAENPHIVRDAAAMQAQAAARGRIPAPVGRAESPLGQAIVDAVNLAAVDTADPTVHTTGEYFNVGPSATAQEGARSGDHPGELPRAVQGGLEQRAGDGDRVDARRIPPAPEPGETFVRQSPDHTLARLTPEVRQEAARILDELETFPFTEKTWHWLAPGEKKTGNAAGGDANTIPASGGAKVYDDVLYFSPVNRFRGKPAKEVRGTRGDVIAALRTLRDTGDVQTNLAEGALRVAEHRAAGDWTELSPAELPPSWGPIAPVAFTDALAADFDAAISDSLDLGGDASFDYGTTIDTLSTGEQQPRLPGDVGDVRNQDVATPAFEAPFALGSDVAPPVKGDQKTFFQQSARPDPVTKTPAFKEWFGDSQAVDEKGHPIVVYHGSNRTFDTFEQRPAMRIDEGRPFETTSQAFFFSEDKATSTMFAKDRAKIDEVLRGKDRGTPDVRPFYLSVQNPLDLVGESRPGMIPLGDGVPVLEEITGSSFEYWPDVQAALDDPTVIDELRQRGYDGVKLLEEGSGISWAVFDPEQIKSTKNLGAFDATDPNVYHQGDGDSPRASIAIGPDRRVTISLFKDADLTSFVHESGHLFLEVLGDLSDQVTARDPTTLTADQARLVQDHQTLLAWLGVETRGDLTTAHHEALATGFEQYLMEGKAPSVALQPAFARFRAWMLDVYKSLRQLAVPLTDDVRAVFDRLLASDQAIADAEARRGQPAMFLTAEDAGMTPERFALYRDRIEAAHQTAVQQLDQRLLADVRREQTAQWKAQQAAIRETVTSELQQQPVYRALAAMRDGTHPDGTPLGGVDGPLKLSRAALVERYGKDRVRQLPRGILSGEGLDPDLLAERLGYPSGDALVQAIARAPDLKATIDQQTQARMLQAHGDELINGQLPALADRALANDDRAQVVRAELKALIARKRDVAPFEKAGQQALAAEQKERAYERRWFDAEAKLRVEIAKGASQETIAALTADVSRLKQQARSGAVTIREGIPSADAITAAAESRINTLPVRAIRPGEFWATSRRAAQQAIEHAARQDFSGAITAKTQELVSLAQYRAAEAAKAAVDDALIAFKALNKPDATIAQTRNVDLVQAARAVLAQVGIGTRPPERIEAYLTSLKTYDPEAHTQILDLIHQATPAAHDYRDMAYGDFANLAAAVESLWTLARTTEQIEVAGEQRQLADVREEVLAQVHRFSEPREKVGYTHAVSGWDRVKVGLLGFRARGRRVEDWVTVVDNGREGIARRAIYDPVNAGAVAYDTQRVALAQRYAAIAAGLDTATRYAKIAAPELNYTFTGKHQELLGALLHTGNGFDPGSNGDKLLRGRGWGQVTATGAVDPRRWFSFVDRMQREGVLTKADYDYVQAVWDLNDSLKGGAQQTHKARFGRYFDEVTHVPFDTPFGTYAGGYYPAIADPFITSTAGDRAEARALLEGGAGGSTMFPSVGRGFTQTRTEGYAKPLILDASQVLAHVNAVLKFTHLSQPVHDVARLILHPSFRAELDAVDPAAVSDLLKPYLDRAASQQMFTPLQGKAGRAADVIAREIRTRGGMQIIALNATVLAEQFTHFPSVLAHADVQAGPLLAGVWRLSREPRAMLAEIHEASPFMATRESAGLVEAHEAINRILLDPNPAQRGAAWVADHATVLMRGIQAGMDAATWQAVYRKVAAEPGATHDTAVLRADAAVRQALGSYRPQDRSAIEGGAQIVGLLNQFYGFFNTKLNMLGTEALLTSRMGLQRRFSRGLAVYGLGFMIPALLGEGIKNAMKGHSPIDQGEDEDAATALFRFWGVSQGKMAARMVPFGGAALTVAAKAFAPGRPTSLINAPSVTMVENALHAPGEAYRALTDTNDRTHAQNAKAITDFFTLLGLLSNLPMRPVGQAVNALHDYAAGPH